MGCSYTNSSNRPEFRERLFQVQMSPSQLSIDNTCFIFCDGDDINCPNGKGQGGIIPTISWSEVPPGVVAFALIMESNETHFGRIADAIYGCSPDIPGSPCVHMVVYGVPAIYSQIDTTFPLPGSNNISDANYGSSLVSYGLRNDPVVGNPGYRYNGPCPPGFFYTAGISDNFINSPPGTYQYSITIYALSTNGITLPTDRNNTFPYTNQAFISQYGQSILETATINFTYTSP